MIKPKVLTALCILFVLAAGIAYADVLIVADEFPAMEILRTRLKNEEGVSGKVIDQKDLPASLKPFEAVIVYIHRDLSNQAEEAFIDYANNGGKLILLHHSISSGKRKNPHWFPFLGVEVPEGDVEKGGYKWVEPATWQVVNMHSDHFITTNKVVYPERIAYVTANVRPNAPSLPGFTFEDDEVYLNHVLKGPHTVLLGFKYTYPKNGVTYMQDTAGWFKPAGKGWLIYLMPGHRKVDFEDATYGRIVLNAVIWKP